MTALIMNCWHTDLYMLLTDGLMLNGCFCSCWLQVKAGLDLTSTKRYSLFTVYLFFFCLFVCLFFFFLFKGRITCPSSPGKLGILCCIFLIIYSLFGEGFFFRLVS